MIEFALTLSQYSKYLTGPESATTKEFSDKAQCYAKKFQDFLMNENMGVYADYVSLQVVPVISSKETSAGQLSENVEWRQDMGCGIAKLSSIGTPAKCN